MIVDRLHESGQVKHLVAWACLADIARAANLLVSTLRRGNKVLLFGNGGSAADAQHIAAEFVGRYVHERRPLSAIALTTDSSALTALVNDYSGDDIFARQLQALGRPGDLAVGISTSGSSQNVNLAIETARNMDIQTIGLSGKQGGQLAQLSDVAIVVPSGVTARIQEAHITIGHILAEIVDWEMFGFGGPRPLAAAFSSKILSRESLVAMRSNWATRGLRVVWTNGCFDVLHVGHVRTLQAAKAFGDLLIVGVNGDRSVATLKGDGRPIMPIEERAELVASLECVDFVVVFDELTPEAILAEVRPDIHCKGGDYLAAGADLPERAVVEAYGGHVQFLAYVPGHSTSLLLDRVRGLPHEKRDPVA